MSSRVARPKAAQRAAGERRAGRRIYFAADRPGRTPRLLGIVAVLASVPATARGQLVPKPVIAGSPIPETFQRLNIEEVLTNARITLEWTATVTPLERYEYEISYDHAASERTQTATVTLVELDEGELVGKPSGPVESGVAERILIRPQQILPAGAIPDESGEGGVDASARDIVVRVFRDADRLDDDTAQNFVWKFEYDTKRPPPPVLVQALPGEDRLELTWAPPEPATDVESYVIYYCPDVTGAATSTTGALPCDEPRATRNISKNLTTLGISDELKNGVPAAAAMASVDAFGNEGGTSNVIIQSPREVTDFFELYRGQGGAEDGGFCFVATAAYGSYAHPAVRVLRAFRDVVMKRTPAGRALIGSYYRWSPPLAREIAAGSHSRDVARMALVPATAVAAVLLVLPCVGLLALVWLAWTRISRARRASLIAILIAFFAAGEATAARPASEYPDFGLGFEFRGGPYLPALGAEDGGPERVVAFPSIFGSSPNPLYSIGAELHLYRGVGAAGVGASFGFMQFVGKALFGESGEVSRDTTVFNIAPLALVALYRFDWLAENTWLPLSPYVRGGLAYYLWWVTTGTGRVARVENDPENDNDDIVGRGGKWGFTGSAGLALLLNAIEPKAAQNLYTSTTIRGSYVFAEIQVAKVDGFGAGGFDLSDVTWNLGLLFEL